MYAAFQPAGSRYNVALLDDRIAGGCGIYPSPGLPDHFCELVKMYLVPRGKGLGRQLIEESLTFARQYGYRQVYIESMPELRKAMSIYEKFGFRYLQGQWVIQDIIAVPSGCSKNYRAPAVTKEGKELKTG